MDNRKKFRVSVIDAMVLYNEIPSELKDIDGAELFLGDTVESQGTKYLIGYRYGEIKMLPMVAGYIIPVLSGQVKRLNESTAATDQWLIIGYTSEPLFERIKDKIEFVPGSRTEIWSERYERPIPSPPEEIVVLRDYLLKICENMDIKFKKAPCITQLDVAALMACIDLNTFTKGTTSSTFNKALTFARSIPKFDSLDGDEFANWITTDQEHLKYIN